MTIKSFSKAPVPTSPSQEDCFSHVGFSTCGPGCLLAPVTPYLMLVMSYDTQPLGSILPTRSPSPSFCSQFITGLSNSTVAAILLQKAGSDLHPGAITAFLFALMNRPLKQNTFQNELTQQSLYSSLGTRRKTFTLGICDHLVKPLYMGL